MTDSSLSPNWGVRSFCLSVVSALPSAGSSWRNTAASAWTSTIRRCVSSGEDTHPKNRGWLLHAQRGSAVTPKLTSQSQQYESSRADSHVPKFVWLLSALPRFARCLQPLGRVSRGELYPAAPGLILRPHDTGSRCSELFYGQRKPRCSTQSGREDVPMRCPVPCSLLRMLKCDEDGNPTLTDLGEAALERMSGKIH